MMADEIESAVRQPGANWPRLRVKGLLVLMTVGAFVSLFIRAGAYMALFYAAIVFLPILVASLLTLFRWPTPHTPMRLLKWALMVALPVGTLMVAKELIRVVKGFGAAMMVVLFALLILALVWFPQVAGVLVYFHVPKRPESSGSDPFA